MQEQKKYHQRKLAIIEMIELCDENIEKGYRFLQRTVHDYLPDAKKNCKDNIERYKHIKNYLTLRYNR